MATNIDGAAGDCSVHPWLAGRWSFKKIDKPSSWNRACDICVDMGSSHWRMVGASNREKQEENV